MNSTETLQFVRYVAALFPATKVDGFTADAWHDVLHRYPLDQARASAVAVSERQTLLLARRHRRRAEAHPRQGPR
ncbi:hypothetical protein ACU686_40350 [Yinghuangia aomiensis]